MKPRSDHLTERSTACGRIVRNSVVAFTLMASGGIPAAAEQAIVGDNAIEAVPVAQRFEAIGTSKRVQNFVSASIGERVLRERDAVYARESITAGPDSFGEIVLNDDSKILVGENSVISLDDFVRGKRGFSSGSIKVSKGAFRFITGNSAKGFLKVESPLSSIGVRGTLFDVYVTDSGVTRVVLFKGEVEVCSQDNCRTVNRPCDIIEVTEDGAQELPYLRSGERDEERETYNLADLQKRFSRAWRAPTATCAVRAFFDFNLRKPRTLAPEPGEPPDSPNGHGSGGSGPGDPASPCASLLRPKPEYGAQLAQVTGPPGPDPCS